jgi:hypothetical protein
MLAERRLADTVHLAFLVTIAARAATHATIHIQGVKMTGPGAPDRRPGWR